MVTEKDSMGSAGAVFPIWDTCLRYRAKLKMTCRRQLSKPAFFVQLVNGLARRWEEYGADGKETGSGQGTRTRKGFRNRIPAAGW